MIDFNNYEWSNTTPEDHQNLARRANPQELCLMARTYDWRLFPEDVLGWIMAQKCIDLESALTAFLNGEPERFNYMPKRDVPDHYRASARVLDNICLRVNSGFYLTAPGESMIEEARLFRWLKYQDIDRSEGRRGRWILDERIVNTLFERIELPETVALPDNSKKSLLHDVLSPIKDLGVSREHLKYLPEN